MPQRHSAGLDASSCSSSGSDRLSSTLQSTTRSVTSSSTRSINASARDNRVAALAATTEVAINWAEILRKGHEGDHHAQWKWLDTIGQFSLYAKQEPHRYAVLCSGVLSCSVPEVVHFLHSPNAEKYLQNMEALYADKFKDGAYGHRVSLRKLEEEGARPHPDMIDLSVKSAVFGNEEKWSFVDAAYRRQNGESFEKITTSLEPRDGNGTFLTQTAMKHDRYLHNLTTAFSVQPEKPQAPADASSSATTTKRTPTKAQPWKETRVFFYAEFVPPPPDGSAPPLPPHHNKRPQSPFDKNIKERMLKMARSCARLTELVRRRRLGTNDLADHKHGSIFSASSSRCGCCNKSLHIIGIKHCRMCGQSVCAECSHKHERETQVPGSRRITLEDIRACDRCIDRVDRASFPQFDDHAVLAARLMRKHAPKVVDMPSPAPSHVLQDLLTDQLLNAGSDARKESLMQLLKTLSLSSDDSAAHEQ